MPEGVVATDRINGWAGIARHLGCDVTTAIRWAKEAGLPVHQPAGRRGWVYAERGELDAWKAASYSSQKVKANVKGKRLGRPPRRSSALPTPPPESTSVTPIPDQPAEAAPKTIAPSSWRRPWSWWGIIVLAACVVGLAASGYRFADARLSFSAPQLADVKQLTDNGLEKIGLLLIRPI